MTEIQLKNIEKSIGGIKRMLLDFINYIENVQIEMKTIEATEEIDSDYDDNMTYLDRSKEHLSAAYVDLSKIFLK